MGMESPDNRLYRLMTPTGRFCAGGRCCLKLRQQKPLGSNASAVVTDDTRTVIVMPAQLAKAA
jgi:hypothetical protein